MTVCILTFLSRYTDCMPFFLGARGVEWRYSCISRVSITIYVTMSSSLIHLEILLCAIDFESKRSEVKCRWLESGSEFFCMISQKQFVLGHQIWYTWYIFRHTELVLSLGTKSQRSRSHGSKMSVHIDSITTLYWNSLDGTTIYSWPRALILIRYLLTTFHYFDDDCFILVCMFYRYLGFTLCYLDENLFTVFSHYSLS